MAEKKRQCGTCRFFVQTESSGHGRCSHPKRQEAHLKMMLLRPSELGCRTRWGTSLWQDPADDSDPTAPEAPQQPSLPDPIPAQLHYDDEVTSVSIAGSKASRPSYEDDVVDSGAVASGMGSWADPLQDERRRLLMTGNQEALAGARKRHLEKNERQRELIPFAEDEDAPAAGVKKSEETKAKSVPPEQIAESDKSFGPDDFVETERSSDSGTPSHKDELVDEGAGSSSSRSPRIRKLMRNTNPPKDLKAMLPGTLSEMTATPNNPELREQWNSVPTRTPGFELPLSGMPTTETIPSLRLSASAAPIASSPPPPARPVSQARELMSEDRLRQERARRHVSVPMAAESPGIGAGTQSQSLTNRPRLTQAPSQRTAPVEQFRSSPLRGYHPAVKAARDPAPKPTERSTRPDGPGENQMREVSTPPLMVPRRDVPTNPARVAPDAGTQQSEPETRTYLASRSRDESRSRRPYIPLQKAEDPTPFVGNPIEIAADVPRCCGTCTSFRPSGIEGRGSCANEFAGPVQRVVYEQDLACQHTFGSFWLPADEEVWLDELEDFDTSTPRVDAMLARRDRRKHVVLPDLEGLTS